MARKKTVQATTDVNNDGVVDELDTIKAEQVHPNNK